MALKFASNAVAEIPLSTDEHGVIRVGNSRVPLESVISYYREGATAEEIAEAFPALDCADLHYVLGYSLRHRTEVDAYMSVRAQDEARIRDEMDRTFDLAELKARIERRRQAAE
ncbi:MAG: DUF433 domain-containing protein [Planctomycetaceae bacterium]